MTLPIKFIIDSIIQRMSSDGIGIYVLHSGDYDRGDLYVKTYGSNKKFIIHHRVYSYAEDNYIWNEEHFSIESDADDKLRTYINRDRDCWTIEIETTENPFKDIF